jgi:hypothetical protein
MKYLLSGMFAICTTLAATNIWANIAEEAFSWYNPVSTLQTAVTITGSYKNRKIRAEAVLVDGHWIAKYNQSCLPFYGHSCASMGIKYKND